MRKIHGTQTEKNLLKAFAGESQAKNRYTFFAKVARKEGYIEVEQLFLEVLRNEEQHAKEFFKRLEGGEVEMTASYPAGEIKDTLNNLKSAAQGEQDEFDNIYPEFARIAFDEGFDEIGKLFQLIGGIENNHRKHFEKYANLIEEGKYFSEDQVMTWICYKCGYAHVDKSPVNKCPVCEHEQGYFIR